MNTTKNKLLKFCFYFAFWSVEIFEGKKYEWYLENKNKIKKQAINILNSRYLIDNIFLKAINFNNALIFILENNALSKEKLCYLNKIITNKLFKTTRKKQEIGKYRISEVSFGSFKGINAKLIDKKISKIFCEYNKNEFHSKLEIYDMYSKLLLTHPFIDGNGRVMRSIFISEWLKNGYEPFVLTHSDKMKLTEYTNYYLKNHNPQNAIKFLEHLENKYSNFYF